MQRSRSKRKPRAPALCAAACALLLAGPALGFDPDGDGGFTDNPDLLRDPAFGCENCAPLDVPYEDADPFLDIDWSLSLRGAYIRDADGERFEALAIPSVTLTHTGLRGGFAVTGSAELVHAPGAGETRLGALRAAFAADYRADEVTDFAFDADIALTEDAPDGPEVPGGVEAAPLVVSGGAEASAARRFGLFSVAARLGFDRQTYGPTTLVGGTLVDNDLLDNWQVEGGLRLGYAVTPILTAFLDGSVGYQLYDNPAPTPLDAADYQLRAGLGAGFSEILSAEASVGVGLRRFADPAIADLVSTLYDARLVYRPDETLVLTGALTTSVGAPGPYSGGAARLEYAATFDAAYTVNPWVALRASAGWRYADLVGTGTLERGWDAGIGADHLINRMTTLSADYGFTHSETDPGIGEDTHRVTLGVTLTR